MDLLAYAKDISHRIEAQAARVDVPVAVSIIDIHGNIILKHRMNGAPAFAAVKKGPIKAISSSRRVRPRLSRAIDDS